MEKFNYSVHHINYSQSTPQGDWCHSDKQMWCWSPCCSKSPASRQKRPSSAAIGSSRAWKRSWGKQAAARDAGLSSWGTQARARPLSSGGWWHSAVTAWALHRGVLASLRVPAPLPNVSILAALAAGLSVHFKAVIEEYQNSNSYIHVGSSENLFLHIMNKKISFLWGSSCR